MTTDTLNGIRLEEGIQFASMAVVSFFFRKLLFPDEI